MNEPEEDRSPVAIDLASWRKAERARLIEQRLAVPSTQRRLWSEQIGRALMELIGDARGPVVSGYWPFRGEPQLLPLLRDLQNQGIRTALPVVVAKGTPLEFREWKSGDKLAHGVWRIPFPANGPEVVPNVVIAPVVGFDSEGYRLGYGGGFFDRTLAALKTRPTVVGAGFSQALMPTIIPQWHDIPMSSIVTEEGVFPLTSRGNSNK